MPPVTVFDSTNLRKEIQSALGTTEIILSGGPSTFSVLTLAKISSLAPPLTAVPASDYTVTGAGQFLNNTRIYSNNVDGRYYPGTVRGQAGNLLTLTYTFGGAADLAPLLSSKVGTFTLDYLNFTGVHRGWAGNGGLYMTLGTSNNGAAVANPANTNFTLSHSTISLTGQAGFNPAVTNGGGSAFLHSFDNTGTVVLDSNTFDDAGFLSSFNFYNQNATLDRGFYVITDNLFTRSGPNTAVVRRRGSRLTNVTAYLSGNTFENGAFLDVFGTISGIQLDGTNTFKSIAGGSGIRGNYDAVQGNLIGDIELTNTARVFFNGGGLPLKNINPNDNQVLMLDTKMAGAEIYITNSLITNFKFYQAAAGGQGNDLIMAMTNTFTNTHTWGFGDAGNDTLIGASEEDYLDGGADNDSIDGMTGQDTLLGNGGNDTINGGDGDDRVFGDLGNDLIDLGTGTDIGHGGDGNDTILCGSGDDSALGGLGNDSILGDLNNDTINGNEGDDTLSGGWGTDVVTGGSGTDRFVWNIGDGTDIITDFDIPTEQIVLLDTFVATSPGSSLLPGDFATALNLTSLNGANSNKVNLVQTAAFSNTVMNTAIAGLTNAYVLIFNSTPGSSGNKGTLWYDDDWSTTGSLSRSNTDIFQNVTTNAVLQTFTNNNFFVV